MINKVMRVVMCVTVTISNLMVVVVVLVRK